MRNVKKMCIMVGLTASISACGLFSESGPTDTAMDFVHGMAKGDIQQVDKLVYWGPELKNPEQPYAQRLEEAKVNGYVLATYQRLQAEGGLKEAKVIKNDHAIINGEKHATVVIRLIPVRGPSRDTTLHLVKRDDKWYVSVD